MTDVIGITFPGIDSPLSASYTLGHGVSPSIATLEMIPQYGASQVQESGDLVLSCGGSSITVRDCRVDSASSRYSSSGARIITLRLLDRRWKWKFGKIDGRYNLRKSDNSIDSATEKTPVELAELLLDEMGESGYQTGDLPNDTRPEIEWVAENPADKLQELCESVGCHVVLQTDNTVAIRKVGTGASLPEGPQLSLSFGLNPPDKPESMTFVSGPVRFQQQLELEAVGEDTDGAIKLIDDLTYAPTAGWEKESPYSLITSETDANKRALAEKTVFRWYRIKDSISAPEYPEISRLEDILPVDDFLVATQEDNNGKKVPRKAYVYGTFWEKNLGQTEDSENTHCKFDFSLDRERGIVQFSEFVVRLGATAGEVAAADLKLVCSYTGRDSTNNQVVRWTKELPVNGGTPGTGTEVVRQDDVIPTVEELYNLTTFQPDGTQNNLNDDVEPEAQHYLDAALLKYQDVQTDEREYPGILDINPDGAIHQIGWSVRTGSGGGASTQASRNSEYSLAVPSYHEAKRIREAENTKIAVQNIARTILGLRKKTVT